jgi:acyl-CoA dehydrogenase
MSGRFGDILSELYLASAALKRWNDEGRQPDDLPLLDYCMEASFATIERRFDEIIANFPVRPIAWLLRFLVQPLGPRRRGPSDRVIIACAEIITNACAARDRLIADLFTPSYVAGCQNDGVAILEHAFASVVLTQPIRDKMHAARVRDVDVALGRSVITESEAVQMKAASEAVSAAIAVNDFAPEELSQSREMPFQPTSRRPAAE